MHNADSFKIEGRKKSALNTPVLLIFFNRPEQFQRVFEQVAAVRPAVLFLYQDGPRNGKNDEEGIAKCRQIAEKIDWTCTVYTYYQERNVGCDPSEYLAQKWAFSIAERCIVLEDDDVPSESFFYFCEELLEKYKDDERINMIAGQNNLECFSSDEGADYFFSTICSIWGWASWRRVVERWTADYEFINNSILCENIDSLRDTHAKQVLKAAGQHKKIGKAYYESILASDMFLNHRLNIVPTKNLISNIGIAAISTHATNDIRKLPHGIRSVFNMKTYSYEFPLKDPRYVYDNIRYNKKVKRLMGWGHPIVCTWRRMEVMLLKILYPFRKGKV